MNHYRDLLHNLKRHSRKIEDFCTPLKQHFGATHFFYNKITQTGKYMLLGNSMKWLEHFFEKKLHLTVPHFRHPKHFNNGIIFVRSVADNQFQSTMNVAKNEFNIFYSLTIHRKDSEGNLESFGFGLNSDDEMQHSLLFNELSLLNFFCDRFCKEHLLEINNLERHSIDFLKEFGANFDTPSLIMQPSFQRDLFLKHFGVHIPSKLSERDNQVLSMLLKGFTARQIGEKLYLSKRTIEAYIERLKNKFNVFSKPELIQKVYEYKRSDFL